MKRIIIFLLLFAALKVAGQTTGYLRFDTVKIMKQNGTCELYVINSTKDSLGLLTNVGGGLTQFRKSKVLNDSTIVIGLDTLVISGAAGGGITELTGDVVAGPGSGSQAATIADNAVTGTKFRQSAALSVVGNPSNSTDDVIDITAANDHGVLRRFGTSINFGAINLASSNAVTGLLPIANGGTGSANGFTWQQTLNVGNTTSSTLYFDTTMVGNPVSKEWANYAPLVKTDTATNAFHQWQFSGSNNGSFNEVMLWGWNVGNGGGQHIAGYPAIGESWESNYQINPAYPASSDRLMEKHEIYVTPDNTQHRLSSYTINTNTGTIGFYHTVGSFSLYNVDTHTPYLSALGVSDNTQQTWINSSDQTEYFSLNADFDQDATTANFTFGANSGKPVNLFNVTGFTAAAMPNTTFSLDGYDGSEIRFDGATTGVLGRLLFDSSQTNLTAFTDVPMNFVNDGIITSANYKTKIKTSVPLAVNTNNFASTPFAALESSAISASLEAAGWFRHSGTAASNKYGIEVSAIGANGTNEALYLNASNASTNRAIRIQFPTAGASNWAIYSDATAQSYHAGKFGIGNGVTSPDSTLQINGSFHNNGGVRMEGLPTGAGTKAVRIDANGTLSVADTTAAVPIILKGTTNWTPGIVAAGSSTTTTVTVTGAVVGDGVVVSKLAGYSNGEVYDAFVSATNTVTIRVHNVSTGSANYSSAADYNVIVLKY